MNSNTLKRISFALLVPATGLAFFMMYQLNEATKEIPDRLIPEPTFETGKADTHEGEHAAEAKAEGHGEAKPDAHGGGHGEPKADAHGGGGGHGEAKAEGHGGGGEHGAAPVAGDRAPAAAVGLYSVEDIYVNVGTGNTVKSLGLKLEIELFEEETRPLFEANSSGIKHTIIEASRQQDATRLSTIAGKLYFKEYLATRLNGFFKQPVVREVHFSTFYLQ